jgi:hypothetical protein
MVGRHWVGTTWAVHGAVLGGAGTSLADVAPALRRTASEGQTLGLLLLACGALLGAAVFAGKVARRLSVTALWTLVALALLHRVASWLAVVALDTPAVVPRDQVNYPLLLQSAEFGLDALGPPAAALAVLGAGVAAWRWLRWSWASRDRPNSAVTPQADPRRSHWAMSSALPPPPQDGKGRQRYGAGICLSGGGIRSATFALGALHSLREAPSLDGRPDRSELTRARYLSAVSGGAYAAGALLLATQPDPHREPPIPRRGLDDVFHPGSAEYDHLRNRCSYLADGWKEWLVALLVLLRGAVISTAFLLLLAVTTGRWVGYVYKETRHAGDFRATPEPLWGPVGITLIVVAMAVALWLLSLTAVVGTHPRARRSLAAGAWHASVMAGVLVVLGLVVPLVVWTTGWVTRMQTADSGGTTFRGGLLGIVGLALTTAGLLHRNRTDVRQIVEKTRKGLAHRLGDLGKRVSQALAVYTGLAVVLAVYLMVFGAAAQAAAGEDPSVSRRVSWGTPDWYSPLSNIQLTMALTGVLAAAYLVDETAVGLHPFYRRRLATAFAVRRQDCVAGPDGGVRSVAVPYSWDEETRLENYGRVGGPDAPADDPQIIFCAAAHCSDSENTPPGRHLLPYTFSFDAVGGPEVGWCRTDQVRHVVRPRLETDLTVETAMAVSGAAFASASGVYRGPANVLLGLTNARLGTWVARPGLLTDPEPGWWKSPVPLVRRQSFLLREVFGRYPLKLPLIFVSDGGHYDNLGLVELLRHRCTDIYCFDATSDAEGFATALGRSLALAYDELGVTITLDDHPDAAMPGAAPAENQSELKARLAVKAVLTGRIDYPDLGNDLPAAMGTLVIGRATLTPDTPWEVLRHAATHRLFPHDATGDQWFDDTKFNAYTALGRHVGRCAVNEMAARHRCTQDVATPVLHH